MKTLNTYPTDSSERRIRIFVRRSPLNHCSIFSSAHFSLNAVKTANLYMLKAAFGQFLQAQAAFRTVFSVIGNLLKAAGTRFLERILGRIFRNSKYFPRTGNFMCNFST